MSKAKLAKRLFELARDNQPIPLQARLHFTPKTVERKWGTLHGVDEMDPGFDPFDHFSSGNINDIPWMSTLELDGVPIGHRSGNIMKGLRGKDLGSSSDIGLHFSPLMSPPEFITRANAKEWTADGLMHGGRAFIQPEFRRAAMPDVPIAPIDLLNASTREAAMMHRVPYFTDGPPSVLEDSLMRLYRLGQRELPEGFDKLNEGGRPWGMM